jgi:hypothetical protein
MIRLTVTVAVMAREPFDALVNRIGLGAGRRLSIRLTRLRGCHDNSRQPASSFPASRLIFIEKDSLADYA